jgi:hypothetical protein
MYRAQANIPILPLVLLGLALIGAVLLLGNINLPLSINDQSSQQMDLSVAPAMPQEHRSEIDRWRTLDANSQVTGAVESVPDRWESWYRYYQVQEALKAYQSPEAIQAAASRWEELAGYNREEKAPEVKGARWKTDAD